jgi:hypothetical protein
VNCCWAPVTTRASGAWHASTKYYVMLRLL